MVLFPKPASKKSPLWYLPWLVVVVLFFMYVIFQIQEGQKQSANPPTTWERKEIASLKLPAVKFCVNPAAYRLFGNNPGRGNWCGARNGADQPYELCAPDGTWEQFPGLPDSDVSPGVWFSYGRRCYSILKSGERVTQPCYYPLGSLPAPLPAYEADDVVTTCIVHNELRLVELKGVGSAGEFMRVSFAADATSTPPTDPVTHTRGTSVVMMHVLGAEDSVYDEGEKYVLPAGSYNVDINPILLKKLGKSESDIVFRPIFLPTVDDDEPNGLASAGPGSHVVSLQLGSMSVDVIEETDPLSPSVVLGLLGGGWGLMQLTLSILYKTESSWTPR